MYSSKIIETWKREEKRIGIQILFNSNQISSFENQRKEDREGCVLTHSQAWIKGPGAYMSNNHSWPSVWIDAVSSRKLVAHIPANQLAPAIILHLKQLGKGHYEIRQNQIPCVHAWLDKFNQSLDQPSLAPSLPNDTSKKNSRIVLAWKGLPIKRDWLIITHRQMYAFCICNCIYVHTHTHAMTLIYTQMCKIMMALDGWICELVMIKKRNKHMPSPNLQIIAGFLNLSYSKFGMRISKFMAEYYWLSQSQGS